MLKVAITGNIASGKSTVEELLIEKGFDVLDTDIVAHDLLELETIKEQLISGFKNYDIIENNEISRKKLGKIVFEDEALRKKLERILHPLIKDEIGRFFHNVENSHQKTSQKEKIAFVSIPLLFEAKFESLFDKIILVYSDDQIRLERLMKRNNLSLQDAKNRLKSQISQDEKTSLADYVIYNNELLSDLNNELIKVIELV